MGGGVHPQRLAAIRAKKEIQQCTESDAKATKRQKTGAKAEKVTARESIVTPEWYKSDSRYSSYSKIGGEEATAEKFGEYLHEEESNNAQQRWLMMRQNQ